MSVAELELIFRRGLAELQSARKDVKFTDLEPTWRLALLALPRGELGILKFTVNGILREASTVKDFWSKEDRHDYGIFVIEMLLWAGYNYLPKDDDKRYQDYFSTNLTANLLNVDQTPTEFVKIMTGDYVKVVGVPIESLFSAELAPKIKVIAEELLNRHL